MPNRIGYAGGAFDLFHVGHLNILKHARSQCDYLIAGVVSDELLELTKGRRPIVPLSERLEIVRHIRFVDEAVEETLLDKLDTWQSVRFDIYFKGDDWKGTDRGRRLERAFAEVGGGSCLLPLHDEHLEHHPPAGTQCTGIRPT